MVDRRQPVPVHLLVMDESKQYWDPKYEFNAPRFYDFAAQHDDSDGDVWFDSVETAGTPGHSRASRDGSDLELEIVGPHNLLNV